MSAGGGAGGPAQLHPALLWEGPPSQEAKRPRRPQPGRLSFHWPRPRHPFLPAASTHTSLNSQAAGCTTRHSPHQERQSARPRGGSPGPAQRESSPQSVRAPCSVSLPARVPSLTPRPLPYAKQEAPSSTSHPPSTPRLRPALSGFRDLQVSGPELLCQVLLQGCCPDPWNPHYRNRGASEAMNT